MNDELIKRLEADPSWDYSVFWELIGEIEHEFTYLKKALCSESAENKNPETDAYIRGKIEVILKDFEEAKRIMATKEGEDTEFKLMDLSQRRKRTILKNGNALKNLKELFKKMNESEGFEAFVAMAAQTVDSLPNQEVDRLITEIDKVIDSGKFVEVIEIG